MPNDFDEITATAPKNVEIASVGIAEIGKCFQLAFPPRRQKALARDGQAAI
jgi:hypothetical protein